MLGDEGDRHHDERHAIAPGARDLGLRRGSDPLQRPDPALVADPPVQIPLAQGLHHGRHGALDLPLVGVAALDDLLRQAVGGEQHPRRAVPGRLRERRTQPARDLGHETGFGRITAQRPGRNLEPNPRRRAGPGREGGPGRGRGELRIERQEDDPLRVVGLDRARGLLAHGVPVAHGDEGLDLAVPGLAVPTGLGVQDRLQRPSLGLGVGEQRRAAAQFIVDPPRHRRPAPRNPLGEQPAERSGCADDRRIVEQVEEERPHRPRPVRAAEIEKNDRGPGHLSSALPRNRFSPGPALI